MSYISIIFDDDDNDNNNDNEFQLIKVIKIEKVFLNRHGIKNICWILSNDKLLKSHYCIYIPKVLEKFKFAVLQIKNDDDDDDDAELILTNEINKFKFIDCINIDMIF